MLENGSVSRLGLQLCHILTPPKKGECFNRGMARLRYLNTFIDEVSCETPICSSRSWPLLPGVKHNTREERQAAGYVAELNQTAGPAAPGPQAQEQDCEVETEVEAEAVQTSNQMGNQIDNQVGNQESVEAAALEGHHLVPEPVIPSAGSIGHPVLCRRPCIRFAKGSCEMGDACDYCHLGQHFQFKALDKRQRLQVRKMDASACCGKTLLALMFLCFPDF